MAKHRSESNVNPAETAGNASSNGTGRKKKLGMKDKIAADHPEWTPEQIAAEYKRLMDPAARFKRLAVPRVAKLLKSVKAVAVFGNKAQYTMTDTQRDWILAQVRDAVTDMARRLCQTAAAAETLEMPE